ncbi:DUF1841 family protein [Thiothrix eikelboomii]|uniref:DUF1841 family protein n=1 Tax=Thiothrix eikelboomii TaxID=92487 RepID=UPI003BB025B5
MISAQRENLRRYYLTCWQKQQAGQALEGLEKQVAAVILEHPEYHALLTESERALQQDYAPEHGASNPFLHMGLHLGLREQVATNRPVGIRDIYDNLAERYGPHDTEHLMMECLVANLWQAQQQQQPPDETTYLNCLVKLG